MTYRLFSGLLILVSLSVCSCKTKEPVADTQSKSNQAATDTSVKPVSADRERVAEKESWLGSEIIDESCHRLKSKLSTKNTTDKEIRIILTESFNSIGGEMAKSYPSGEARAMGRKIIINSKDKIINALETDEQRTNFKNLFVP